MEHPPDPDTAPQVSRSVELDADADEVWRLLTDDEERAAWFGGDTDLDVRPGGRGHVTEPDGRRRAVEVGPVEPGRRLGWTWWPEDGGPASDVEFVIEPIGRRARLTVTERRSAVDGVTACASGAALDRMVDLELLVLTRVVGVGTGLVHAAV